MDETIGCVVGCIAALFYIVIYVSMLTIIIAGGVFAVRYLF